MKKIMILLVCLFHMNIYSGDLMNRSWNYTNPLEDSTFNYIIYSPFIVLGKVLRYLGLNAPMKKPSDKCVLIKKNADNSYSLKASNISLLKIADKLEDVVFNKIKGDFSPIRTETYKNIAIIKSESLEQVNSKPHVFKTSSGKYIGIDCDESIEVVLMPHFVYYPCVARDFGIVICRL